MRIPYIDMQKVTALYEPEISRAAMRTIASGCYINGPERARFERDFAQFCGTDYCIGVGNGLEALTLILKAMKQLYGWDSRAEIVVPAFTFIASAQAVTAAGLTLTMADVCHDAPTLDPASTIARSLPTVRPSSLYTFTDMPATWMPCGPSQTLMG